MKTYLVRSLRYLTQLVLIFVVLYAALYLFGYVSVQPVELFTVHSHWLFVGLLVFLAAIYPMYGYVDRPMKADMDADRSKILKTMDMGDYYLAREEGGRMVFHKQSILKRMLSIGQDTIIITREGAGIVVSGLRKEVVKVDYRLRAQFE